MPRLLAPVQRLRNACARALAVLTCLRVRSFAIIEALEVELDALAEEQQTAPGAVKSSAETAARRKRGGLALGLGGLAAVAASLDLAEPRVLAAGAAILAAFGLVEFVGSAAANRSSIMRVFFVYE